MRSLLCGDFHLDRLTAGYDRYDDVCGSADVTVEAAIKAKADLYVFLGDLTNPNNVRSHRAVAKGVQVGRRLAAAGVESVWLTGNHDVIEDGSGGHTLLALREARLRVMDEPQIYAPEGLTVMALPFVPSCNEYDPAEFVEQMARRYSLSKGPVLVVGHLALDGATLGSETTDMPRGRTVEWPVKAIGRWIPNAVMVGGHYHRRHEHRGVRFAGSPERLAFSEEENVPGYIVVEV